jgi:hypothetical protein
MGCTPVYAYEVQSAEVIGVKLLVSRDQDPALFVQHRALSAYSWMYAVKISKEPVALG